MKLLIARDVHGSARYTNVMLELYIDTIGEAYSSWRYSLSWTKK